MSRTSFSDPEIARRLDITTRIWDQARRENSDKAVVDISAASMAVEGVWRSTDRQRVVVGVGGFPGSGKTTLSKLLIDHFNKPQTAKLAARLPMDGFHFSNRTLDAKGLRGIKGDVSTYDVGLFLQKIRECREAKDAIVYAPDYVREAHDVFENAIKIDSGVGVIITEGIYIGISIGAWMQITSLLDYLIYLDVSPSECIRRVIHRNLLNGRSDKAIKLKICNDLYFMETAIRSMYNAALIIRDRSAIKDDTALGIEL
jgi:pantothenate kinase